MLGSLNVERMNLWESRLVFEAGGAISRDRRANMRRRPRQKLNKNGSWKIEGEKEGREGVKMSVHDTREENERIGEGWSASPAMGVAR